MQRKEKIDQFLINSRGIFRQQVSAAKGEVPGIQIVGRRQKIKKEWGKKRAYYTYAGCIPLFLLALFFACNSFSEYLRKQTIFRDATNYPDLGSASDRSCHLWNLLQPIRSTTQIWVVTCHQYGISVLISQMSFCGESVGDVTKCCLFSQATWNRVLYIFFWNL